MRRASHTVSFGCSPPCPFLPNRHNQNSPHNPVFPPPVIVLFPDHSTYAASLGRSPKEPWLVLKPGFPQPDVEQQPGAGGRRLQRDDYCLLSLRRVTEHTEQRAAAQANNGCVVLSGARFIRCAAAGAPHLSAWVDIIVPHAYTLLPLLHSQARTRAKLDGKKGPGHYYIVLVIPTPHHPHTHHPLMPRPRDVQRGAQPFGADISLAIGGAILRAGLGSNSLGHATSSPSHAIGLPFGHLMSQADWDVASSQHWLWFYQQGYYCLPIVVIQIFLPLSFLAAFSFSFSPAFPDYSAPTPTHPSKQVC